MRILVVGDGHSGLHEVEVAKSFNRIGHTAQLLAWNEDFRGTKLFLRVGAHLQSKYIFGSRLARFEHRSVAVVEQVRPELIFVYRGTHVRPELIERWRSSSGARIVGYNNDNPFTTAPYRGLWRHYLRSIPHYDAVCYYRPSDREQVDAAGARRSYLLRSWFRPTVDYPRELSEAESARFGSDVSLIAHFEDDGRDRSFAALNDAGLRVRLFGPPAGWGPLSRELNLSAVTPVIGEDYAKAISGASMCLCFLSKRNRDSYTRRCFEIPAIGSVLVSEHTEDLASLFIDGEEAVFFQDQAELVAKCRELASDPERRAEIARRGRERVWRDGHDVDSRLRAMLEWLAALG